MRNDDVPSSVKGTVHAGTELIATTFENVPVTSIYKPPPAKLTFPPDFFDMNQNNIIIGDFNSHNHLWGYRDDDENGLFLDDNNINNNIGRNGSYVTWLATLRSGYPRTTFTSPKTPSCRTLSTAEVEATLQPWPRLRVTELTRHMSSESVLPHSSLITPPSWGCHQPHDHPFGAAFPPPIQLQKGQLGNVHHYPWQWHYLSSLAIVEGIQIIQWPS